MTMSLHTVTFALHTAGYALIVALYLWMFACLTGGRHPPAVAYALVAVAYVLVLAAFLLEHPRELAALAAVLPKPSDVAQADWPEMLVP